LSKDESGNFNGALVVSISKANTTGSALATLSGISFRVMEPLLAATVYHLPIRISRKELEFYAQGVV
jgi:hypothetical protein